MRVLLFLATFFCGASARADVQGLEIALRVLGQDQPPVERVRASFDVLLSTDFSRPAYATFHPAVITVAGKYLQTTFQAEAFCVHALADRQSIEMYTELKRRISAETLQRETHSVAPLERYLDAFVRMLAAGPLEKRDFIVSEWATLNTRTAQSPLRRASRKLALAQALLKLAEANPFATKQILTVNVGRFSAPVMVKGIFDALKKRKEAQPRGFASDDLILLRKAEDFGARVRKLAEDQAPLRTLRSLLEVIRENGRTASVSIEAERTIAEHMASTSVVKQASIDWEMADTVKQCLELLLDDSSVD